MLKKIVLSMVFVLALAPAGALAQTIDFGLSALNGTWSWGGAETALSGDSTGALAIVEVNGIPVGFGTVGPVDWTTGTAGAFDGTDYSLAACSSTSTPPPPQTSTSCGMTIGGVYVGTFTGGTITPVPGAGEMGNLNFTFGNLDPSILSAFGLPSTTYNGSFNVTLDFSSVCPSAEVTTCGNTWVSGDLDLHAVPEPGTLTLVGTGLLSLAGIVRRRFKKSKA